jgi:hypothetical protein
MDIRTRSNFPDLRRLVARLGGMFVLLMANHSLTYPQNKPPAENECSGNGPAKVTAKKVVAPEPLKPIDLSHFPDGWVLYSAEKEVPLKQIWKVIPKQGDEDAILVCTGKPHGYLRTKKEYQNFEISLEWRFPNDPNGNSGLLIYTSKEDKIWPNSIQVQLHGQMTGSLFPLGQAMASNNLQVRDLMLTPQQWNRLTVKSRDGHVSVAINDKELGEITGCNPSTGSISLQSEGAEIHFRRIQIRELKSEESAAAADGRDATSKDDDES